MDDIYLPHWDVLLKKVIYTEGIKLRLLYTILIERKTNTENDTVASTKWWTSGGDVATDSLQRP